MGQASETVTRLRSGIILVSPAFFETYGIHFVAGRAITKQDRAGSLRVAVVNEGFVRSF